MINGGFGGSSFSKVYYFKNIFRFKTIFVEIILVYTILTSFFVLSIYKTREKDRGKNGCNELIKRFLMSYIDTII